jgi:glycosyltransferase involved in cell wall biosynthesis
MARAMLKVLSDKEFSAKLVKKGQKQFKKYSWRKTAKQTLEVYNKALKK